MPFAISEHHELEQLQVAEVKALIGEITLEDGIAPLGEHVLIHLHHGGDTEAIQLLARDAKNKLVGYLHLDVTDSVSGPAVEVAVHPKARGQGIATTLVHRAEVIAGNRPIRLWAHGTGTTAHQLAHTLGYDKVRELWQMRRSLFASLPKLELPDGLTLRTFVPGQDEQAWLELNAQIFHEHPDQGSWTLRDLEIRMSEKWFDTRGFFLAINDAGAVVGFHWTKVHGGHRHENHHHPEIGEAYVLGVRKDYQGTGLGKALTIKGLEYLREQGVPSAMLYVEANNARAIRLYESVGFAHWDTDIMFKQQ